MFFQTDIYFFFLTINVHHVCFFYSGSFVDVTSLTSDKLYRWFMGIIKLNYHKSKHFHNCKIYTIMWTSTYGIIKIYLMGKTAAIIIDKCHIGWIYLYFCNVDKSLVLFLKGAIAIGCSPRAKNKCSLHTGSFEIIYDLCDSRMSSWNISQVFCQL